MALDPATVASSLTNAETRTATLDALEAHRGGPYPTPLAVAAAPALTDVMCLDAAEVDHALFQRVGLLRARLLADAALDDVAAIFGAMMGGGRLAAFYDAPHVIARTLAKPAAELDQAHALSLACWMAFWPAAQVRGW